MLALQALRRSEHTEPLFSYLIAQLPAPARPLSLDMTRIMSQVCVYYCRTFPDFDFRVARRIGLLGRMRLRWFRAKALRSSLGRRRLLILGLGLMRCAAV
jgi:hypothetical protein